MESSSPEYPKPPKHYREYWAWIPHTGVGIPPCNLKAAKLSKPQEISPEAVKVIQDIFPIDFSSTSHSCCEGRWEYYGFNKLDKLPRPFRGHLIRVYVNNKCEPICMLIWASDANGGAGRKEDGSFPRGIDHQLVAGIKVLGIDKSTGIISFTLYMAEQYIHQDTVINNNNFDKMSHQLYRILRKCYHKHVWSNGDLVVRPVSEVSSPQEAAEKIWDTYFNHRLFTDTVNDIKRAYFKTFSPSERKWAAIRETCASGMGELLFAETLAKYTESSHSPALLDACKRGRDSYDTIWRLITAKETARKDGVNISWARWSSIGQYMGVGAALLGIYWQVAGIDLAIFILIICIFIVIPGAILYYDIKSRGNR